MPSMELTKVASPHPRGVRGLTGAINCLSSRSAVWPEFDALDRVIVDLMSGFSRSTAP